MDDIVQLEYGKEEEKFDLFYFGSYLPERYEGAASNGAIL